MEDDVTIPNKLMASINFNLVFISGLLVVGSLVHWFIGSFCNLSTCFIKPIHPHTLKKFPFRG
jgi:hypothetical protein